MTRFLCGVFLLVCPAAICLGEDPIASSQPNVRTAAELLPPTIVAYAELNDPSALLSTIFDHPLVAKIEQLPPYQSAIESAGYKQFLLGRQMVETHLEMPWREALQTIAAGGVFLAFDAESQGIAVLVQGKDAASTEKFREKLIQLAMLGKNAGRIQSVQYRGIDAYRLDQARYAVVDNWSLLTNNSELGKQIIDRLIDGPGKSFANNERFRAAHGQKLPDSTTWAFVDVETIRNAGAAEALFSDRPQNPVVELLAGGLLSSLQQTPQITLQANVRPDVLDLRLRMPHQSNWVPEQREYYFGPEGQGRGPALPATQQTLFTLSTYRDVSEVWLRAGDLFDEKVNDGLAQADANLTTLFAGRDFGEDILGSLEPEIGLVATRQDFAGVLPRPTIQLPSFALVLRLRDPDTMTRELRRTFQSMIGFFNVVGAMQGNPQLELDMEKLDQGVELITSSYIPEDDERESTEAKIAFNFSPSIGFVGDRFVVASTTALARELTTAAAPTPALIDDNTRVQLHPDVLQQVLRDNRGQLVAQNQLEEGNSREEAEASIDLLLEVVGFFSDAMLRLHPSEGQLEVQFQVKVDQ